MKKLVYKIIVSLTLIGLVSCNEELLIDQVFNETTRGAVLRSVVQSGSFNSLDVNSTWEVTLSADDVENGGLMREVRVFVSFVDKTPENGETIANEAPIATLSPSMFSTNNFGKPEMLYSVSLQECLTALGLTEDQVLGGDDIRFRMQLELSDGRVFDQTNTGNTVSGGSFFRSPFQFTAPLVCELDDYVGDWTFNLVDTFGDGWNNASLDITYDSGSESLTEAVNAGDFASGTFVVSVPTSSSLEVEFGSGDFDGEIGIQVVAPSGNLVFNVQGPDEGVLPLELCDE